MTYHVLQDGARSVRALTYIRDNFQVTCPVLDFLREHSKTHGAACRGFQALFQRYAEGQALTHEMFHTANAEEKILEFIKGPIRVLCFVDGNSIYLTNAYMKKSQKADPTEIARAIDAKNDFIKK